MFRQEWQYSASDLPYPKYRYRNSFSFIDLITARKQATVYLLQIELLQLVNSFYSRSTGTAQLLEVEQGGASQPAILISELSMDSLTIIITSEIIF